MSKQPIEEDENGIIALRKQKLQVLRDQGNAFSNDFRRSHLASELHQQYGEMSKQELADGQLETLVAGRILLKRVMGKASFLTIQDVSGRIQLYVSRNNLGEDAYEQFKSLDLGDIIGSGGVMMKTMKGELSVQAAQVRLLTKSLRPLPEKYKGLTDTETRYRQRYIDLMVNEDSREIFVRRARTVEFIRRYLTDRFFMEVETPMMQSTPGGATAAPFVTHYNALDIDMYLRVAPELNLKRLVVGGFERVFEINRNFRNEGMSTKHSPEFTMLEFYWAYADYNDLMDFTEDLFRQVVIEVLGTAVFEYQGATLNFGEPFKRMTMREAIAFYNPDLDEAALEDRAYLLRLAEQAGVEANSQWGIGKLTMELFEALVEDKIQQPVFITQHPIEVSPLARRNDDNPELTDRFELFIMGNEIANGFSELNDAEDQAERFRNQVAAKEAGDDEAMHYDEDYVIALEYGLPPTAGEGIGIDRLVMLITDAASIRDVVLFPHMRPKS
ncbi:MAG: lysine--tRNA ligase [Gammaproteobacteria bacterium]|jgi:lysyl-tRNA synthetase, class II|nr:lysine--tRNA ligase [Gammaproteobacteria bacterium]MBT5204026.1 lysine--tRNA ligase [Gammaproteobacteria bacterium]MBT5602720.1 lysine--tRNA ligase [Gammaproteobacteria bacterium]MBT6243848.1 lysine--tRNA ligase [Gammaproteobacteria bacterium]